MILKNRTKRLLITVSVSASLLASIFILPFTTNAVESNQNSTSSHGSEEWQKVGTIKVDNAKVKIDKASRYKAITDVMSRCVDRVVIDAKEWASKNDSIFNPDKDKEFAVGPWLEHLVTGEIYDGKIECKDGYDYGYRSVDGIVTEFAKMIYSSNSDQGRHSEPENVWYINILCNEWNSSLPGLVGARVGDGHEITSQNGCKEAILKQQGSKGYIGYTENINSKYGSLGYHSDKYGGPGAILEDYPVYSNGREYLDRVLQLWKEESESKQMGPEFEEYGSNKYIPNTLKEAEEWTLDDPAWHWLYRTDFDTRCKGSYTAGSPSTTSIAIYSVDVDTGAGKKEFIVPSTGFYNANVAIQGSYYPGDYDGVTLSAHADCSIIVNAANNSFEPYYKAVKEAYKDMCNANKEELDKIWSAAIIKANLILGKDKDSDVPLILGPDGTKYYISEIIEQDPDAQPYLSDKQISEWGDKAWANYEQNADGEYKVREFSEDAISQAKQVIADYEQIQAQGQGYMISDWSSFRSSQQEKTTTNSDHDLEFATKYPPYTCAVPPGYDLAEAQPVVPSSDDPEAGDSDPCYDAGVEGMSWVLCPALNNTATTVDAIEGVLRDWLQIKSGEMFNDGVYEGWKIFRNIANVILIIIFLAIIFSQLTGYGIDNYGIKKMLPKLIIIAILINLSYIICQLAVDLSNILGVGLDNIMKTVGFTINGGSDPNQGFGVHHIAAILLGAFVAGGTVAGIAISSGGGIMLVVSLLLAALVALVAVLMFFVMLGARMVIVSVFVVLSPVAFVFYILPNTQSLFKKWWKVFEAALVVFPICGALYGASYIAKAIIGPDPSNFFLGMIGVIVPFLPFLVLPSLLKGALAGLGAIGGTLTTLGNSLKKGAQRGKGTIENTKAYKGAQERAADRSAERRATRIRNRLQKAADKRGGIENLSASRRRRLFQAQTTLNERNAQKAQDRVGAFDNSEVALSRAEAARDATEYKAFQDQFADPNFDLQKEINGVADWYNSKDRRSQQRMRALMGTMESRGMESQIFDMLKNGNINVGKDNATMNALANSNNKVLKAYGKKGGGQDFNSFMNGSGDNDSMKGYIKSKGADFINGLDDKALAEIASSNPDAMDTGLLTQAASRISDAESLNQINTMLTARNDVKNLTGEQLASYGASTIGAIQRNGGQNIDAILSASDDIARNPKLVSKMDPGTRGMINAIREQYGKQKI